jgi:ribosomal-protein-alanine N-acetyltransferase
VFTLETPRLILAATPLHVIKMRRQHDDFVAEVPISLEREEERCLQTLLVHFPPEWPGDAVVFLPLWENQLETDPEFEMWGGTIIDRAEMVAAGQMTLMPVPDEPGTVELGYGVNPSYQGQGYATEAARALVRWAKQEPRIRRIIASCLEDNVASVRVLQKAGFRPVGEWQDKEGRSIQWEYPH